MTFTYNKSCETCLYKSICKYEDIFSKSYDELKSIKTLGPFTMSLSCDYYKKELRKGKN